jgi:hypothetical protein
MARYLLTNTDNYTWRGSRIFPGRSVFSSKTGHNVIEKNSAEIGESPLVAIMLNPWHAQLDEPKMLELQFSQVAVVKDDPSINMQVRETGVPSVTTDQKIVFALMVLKEVYENVGFAEWAGSWISGTDRSAESAGKLLARLGKVAQESRALKEALKAAGASIEELDKVGADNSDFCSRASEAIFAAQMYMDRPENWPLLAARSVSRAVAGLGGSYDLAAIAEQAIEATSRGVTRKISAA